MRAGIVAVVMVAIVSRPVMAQQVESARAAPGTQAAPAAQTGPGTQPAPGTQAATDVPVLKGMFPVYVVQKSGDEIPGKLVSLTTTELVLQMAAETRTFDLGGVAQIYRKGDSLKNGAIIGAIFGAATGIVAGLECTGNDTPSSCGAGTRTTIILTSIGAWSAIGVAIDALIPGRTLIWKGR
jgi:hypothetical protein